ncbi:hypothetical protein [Agaribacterium haliotis]|uniref:hypothetical protein n=1 Tax=Agaribacterium haliotis TaxID=2013869 RepID=UPI000BB5860C|nr:hypothetical protein [Agaribacterium haliotis]
MKFLVYIAILFNVVACGSQNPVKESYEALEPVDSSRVYLRFPPLEEIAFYGKPDSDNEARSSGAMLYPGYDMVSFIAGIATHAAVQSSMEAQRDKQREEMANRIVDGYRSVVERINAKSIVGSGRFIEYGQEKVEVFLASQEAHIPEAHVYIAQVAPAFYLTQDNADLIALNTVVFVSNKDDSLRSKNIQVEYLIPAKSPDPQAYWAQDDYQVFRQAVRSAFLKTIEIAYSQYRQQGAGLSMKQRTVRYKEDGEKRVERGWVVNESCDRIEFVTLNKSFKSVPKFRASACELEPVAQLDSSQ